jgi:hypothetical protein
VARHAVRALGLGPVLVIGFLLAPAEPAAGQVTLSLSANTVTFPTADPDTTPVIAAPPFTLTARARRASSWQLTVISSGNLASGSSTIPIANLNWTISPNPPFQNGVMSGQVAQLVGSGTGELNPAVDATVNYFLVNSWTYDVGNYSVTITYTLSAV